MRTNEQEHSVPWHCSPDRIHGCKRSHCKATARIAPIIQIPTKTKDPMKYLPCLLSAHSRISRAATEALDKANATKKNMLLV